MMTSEERVLELHRRMNNYTQEKRNRSFRVVNVMAFAACLALTFALAGMIAAVPSFTTGISEGNATASLFTEHEALGYMIIAMIAFCLGSMVTIFCYRIRKHLYEDNGVRKEETKGHD